MRLKTARGPNAHKGFLQCFPIKTTKLSLSPTLSLNYAASLKNLPVVAKERQANTSTSGESSAAHLFLLREHLDDLQPSRVCKSGENAGALVNGE